jgi:hypothetical protein
MIHLWQLKRDDGKVLETIKTYNHNYELACAIFKLKYNGLPTLTYVQYAGAKEIMEVTL